MSELLDLTAAQAAERVRAGDLERGELWRFYRDRALADDLNAFTWVCEERRAAGDRPERPARRRPDRRSRTCSAPRACPSQAGSKILEGYRPPYTATAVERLMQRRRAGAGQDQPGRVRDGLVDRELRLRARRSTRGTARACPAARRAARRPRWRPAPSRGRSAPTPAARSASPPRCAGSSASSRPTARSRRYGMIAFASSLDQAGPFTRDTTDAALLLGAMAGKDHCDSTSLGLPEPVRAADGDRPQGHPPRRARGADRRGHRARRARRLPGRRSTSRASSAPRSRPCTCRTRRTASPPTT